MKLKWYVDPEPTGRYRSFQRRGWPTCYSGNPDKEDCELLAAIVSLDHHGYEGHYARATNLRLKVRIHFKVAGEDRTGLSKEEFSSIAEAKAWLKAFYKNNPKFYPTKDAS